MTNEEYAEQVKEAIIEDHVQHLVNILTYIDDDIDEEGIYTEDDVLDYCEVSDWNRKKYKIHLYNKDITDEEIRLPNFNKPTNGIIESCLYKHILVDKKEINRAEIAKHIDLREFKEEIEFVFANTGYSVISIKKDVIFFVGQQP